MNEPAWLADYHVFQTGAGLVHPFDRTIVEIGGQDRASFLHNLCTNDIRRLTPGRGCEAFVTNVQGKTLAHVRVFAQPDALIVEAAAKLGEKLLQHFEKYHIREKVEIADCSQSRAELILAGASSEALLRASLGLELPAINLASIPAKISDAEIWIRRVDFIAAPCFLIECDRAAEVAIHDKLLQAGARPCAVEAFEAARIEAAYPLSAADVSDKNLPQEVGRDTQAISFTKGCYLGQETVARIDALGHVNRLMIGVRFESDQAPATGEELAAGSERAGYVASASYSPRLGRPLALAYLRRNLAEPGTVLEGVRGRCIVVHLPIE